jgi:hypothetical protein
MSSRNRGREKKEIVKEEEPTPLNLKITVNVAEKGVSGAIESGETNIKLTKGDNG